MMFIIALVLTFTPQQLADATYASAPKEINRSTALAHATAAAAAATPEFPAELLLAMAYRESRYTVDAVSVVKGKRFCGPLQCTAHSRAECTALRDLGLAYRTAVVELTRWRNDGSCRWRKGAKRLDCVMQGYAGGYNPIKSNWQKPLQVLKRAAAIRRRALRLVAKKMIELI